MKLLLGTVLLHCAIVVFVKADHFSGEVEDNEDELSELVAWDLEDPAIGPTGPPTNLGVSISCFHFFSVIIATRFRRNVLGANL